MIHPAAGLRICLAALILIALWVGHAGISPAAAGEHRPAIHEMDEPAAHRGGEGHPYATGFIPPPIHVPSIRYEAPLHEGASLPSRFDWREQGKVTCVKNQSTCGSCYAFASIASIEARLLTAGEPEFDFSENNAKECEWYESSCSGGNFARVSNFLSQKGTVLETCDPYVPGNVSCVETCPYVITLLGWSLISGSQVPDPEVIKSYIYTYGPVYTSFYAGWSDSWSGEMRNYDGSYTLYYGGDDEPNHAVLLLGWDDDLSHAGGKGAWIAKNSWGDGWGGTCGYGSERGFFTMGYGSANIGGWTSFMSEWQDYDPDGRLMYYDEGGYSEDFTDFGSLTGWGMCRFVAAEDIRIERVEFWTSDATTDVDVYVYDTLEAGAPAGVLASTLDHSFAEIGYHSVELPDPVVVETGDDVYAAVRFTNVSFTAPIALDDQGIPETGACFVSYDGIAWKDVKTVEGHEDSDVCIRLRGTDVGSTHIWRVPGDAETIAEAAYSADPGDTVLVGPGTYHETSIVIDKAITIIGEAGPESTIIDAGFGALRAYTADIVTFENTTSSTALEGFTITGMTGVAGASAINIDNASPRIQDCIITGISSSAAAAILITGGTPRIRNCTIYGNTLYSAVYCGPSTGGIIENCIISNTAGGAAIACASGADPVVSCCDIYNNSGGDMICGTDGGGNFSMDPLFCNAAGGDLSLQDDSPCLTGFGCGRVGALGQGCPTHVPAALTEFSVTPGDNTNSLEWTLPAPPVQGAYIVYSTAGYPAGPSEGLPVDNGNGGYFAGTPSGGSTFSHGGLENGTAYYYTAFAYNGEQFSGSGLHGSGTPEDTGPPAPPADLTAQPDVGQITLGWTYPGDHDLEGVIIRYSIASYPEGVGDGSPVENGAGGEFAGEPGAYASFTHTGLVDDITYYYSVFAFDEIPYYSAPSQISSSPGDAEPPASPPEFTVEAADSALKLAWTNPGDLDFEGTLIRYSTASFPLSPDEGSPVENGESGVFQGEPASADSFTHAGLENGVVYYYTAFAFDGRLNYSDGKSEEGTPADKVPPGAVGGFTATPGDRRTVLRWTNPADADYEHTLVRYSTYTYPATPLNGNPVDNGAGGVFPGTAAQADSFVHTGLANNVTYYYAAFAADEVPNYAQPATAASTPEDTLSPPPVSGFTAAAGDGSTRLFWTSPDEADLDGVMIRYSTDSYPAAPDLGTPVENGSGGAFAASPAAADSFDHAGLTNETLYYYSIFAFDEVPNYSVLDTASAMPFDQTPPDLSVSVFQNPYITSHIDVYVIASEAMADTSLRCSVGGTDVTLCVSDGEENVCRGDFDLCTTGGLSIEVSGRDLRGNPATATRDFYSSAVLALSGGAVRSPDGGFTAEMPAGRLREDAYILVFEDEWEEGGTVYRMSPRSVLTDGFFEISIAYRPGADDPERLTLAEVEDGRAVPLVSFLRRDEARITAFVDGPGSYMLMRHTGPATPDYGNGELRVAQNAPNPFAGRTSIAFELPGVRRVRADVITVGGRVVRTLVDDVLPPGRHNMEWDGRGADTRPVGSGIYLYRIRTDSEVVTRKMVVLR